MEEREKLSIEELEDITKFSQGLAYADAGFYSPFMSNYLLQGLTTVKNVPSYEKIRDALADYKKSPEGLAEYTDFASVFDMLFKRVLYSYANSLSYDFSYVCTNAYTQEDYESDAYLADKKRIEDFILGFDCKQAFYNVALNCLKHQNYFTWFRKTKQTGSRKSKYALQILPQDYCKLTGVFDKGYLFSMNMMYFMQPGVDINTFDPSLKETYIKTIENKEKMYVPSAPLNDRNGTYALWTDVSPENGAWCFRHDQSDFTPIPFLSPYVKSMLRADEIEQLQYNKDLISAYGILAGEIQLYDGAKSGEQKDQFAINLKLLGQLLSKAKAGFGSLVKVGAMPTKNNDFYQFNDSNKDMYVTALGSSVANGTGASRTIYATDRMSAAELEGAQNEIYQTMARSLYPQFENFLEFFGNKMTKKYHFKFVFSGSSYRWEQESRFEKMIKLADKGIVLSPSYFASTIGMNPAVFEAEFRESKYSGWVDKFSQLLMNTNTASSDDVGGRPKETGSVEDSTERSREEL